MKAFNGLLIFSEFFEVSVEELESVAFISHTTLLITVVSPELLFYSVQSNCPTPPLVNRSDP